MQVRPQIWKEWTRKDLLDPETNLLAGTKILKGYLKNSKTLDEALHKYSGGAKDYAKKVKERM